MSGAWAGRLLARLAEAFALLGGAILLAVVLVATVDAGAILADRGAALWGGSVSGLPGYEEFVRLAVSAAVLMFFPYCQLCAGHVTLDLAPAGRPGAARDALDRFWRVAAAATALFLAWWMIIGAAQKRADAAITSVLGWPEWPFYLPGAAALGLWAAIALHQSVFTPSQEASREP